MSERPPPPAEAKLARPRAEAARAAAPDDTLRPPPPPPPRVRFVAAARSPTFAARLLTVPRFPALPVRRSATLARLPPPRSPRLPARSPVLGRLPPGLSTCWPLLPRKSMRSAAPALRLLLPNLCWTFALLYRTPWRCEGLCCQLFPMLLILL